MSPLMRRFGPVIAGVIRCGEALCVTEAVLASRAAHWWVALFYAVGAGVAAFLLWETYRHIKPHCDAAPVRGERR